MSSLRSFLYPNSPPSISRIKITPDEVKMFQEACVSDAAQINRHLDTKFDDLSENFEHQISAIEDIAQNTQKQAESIS